MRHRPAVAATALAALAFSAACAVLAVLLAGSWAAGRPAVTPLEAFHPEVPLLVPGEALPLPWGEALRVTPELVRAMAAVNLLLFAGGALLWAAAGAGLLRLRRWGRGLGLLLFSGTALIGVWNLFIGLVLTLLEGSSAAAAMALPLVAVLLFLVVVPGYSAGLLLRPAVARAFRESDPGSGRPAVTTALAIHFALVTVVLAGAAVAPESFGEPRLLVGPWVVGGPAARLLTATLAGVHGVAGWACWRQRRSAYRLSLGLNAAFTMLAALSAATARQPALDLLGAGLLPASAVRGLLVAVAVLGASLVIMVRAARRPLTTGAAGSR